MDVLGDNRGPWEVYETELPSSSCCDPGWSISPEEQLSLDHLLVLKEAFTCCTPSDRKPGDGGHSRTVQREEGGGGRGRGGRGAEGDEGMTLKEFRDVLSPVIGSDSQAGWIEQFYKEVDITCVGSVAWGDLCGYLLQQARERDLSSIPRGALLDTEPLITHCSHNKQEPTTRVVAVPHPPPFRYISVSKGGLLTVWNSRLHILKTLELVGDPTEEGANRRRFRGWTTDAVHMPNVHKVAIATSSRDIHFVDVSTASCFEEVHLFGFRNVPTALCYSCDIKAPGRRSLLLWGDERGGVHLLWFLLPLSGLFESPFSEANGPQKIYMQDLGDHSHLVSYQHLPSIHQEPINRVLFDPHTDLIMTSSGSDESSVVIMDASLKRNPYIWNIMKGVQCFDYSRPLGLLVTGGLDPAVRLWNRFVPSRPVATLEGHGTTVVDLAFYQPLAQVLSYSKDAEVRVWDISSHRCLRTLHLQFPCLQPGHSPEYGNFPFLLVTPPLPSLTPPHLLVSCKDFLALLRLGERGKGGDMERIGGGGWREAGGVRQLQHTPFSCALYNPTLRQVVTGSNDSTVLVWDVATGAWLMTISNAHGEEEVTCMALDSSHRRLITASTNGTIKVWNLLNGHNLHKLEPVTSSEVTGIICLYDNQLLAVGWSQQIVQYDITGAKDVCVKADMSWKSGRIHKADIQALAHCPALGVVATASHDGEIIVWAMDTQRPLVRLRRNPQSGVAPPVENLLFLQARAGARQWRSTAVLVSSQDAWICFWSIAGHTHTQGEFRPSAPAGEVLCLTSDQDSSLLVSGDRSGYVKLWDISQYALAITLQPTSACPPLLRSWRAHQGALVSLELLQEDPDALFLLTASGDGSARLWTGEGVCLGTFGLDAHWDLQHPDTYHGSWHQETTVTEKGDEGEVQSEKDQSGSNEVRGQLGDLVSQGQTSQEEDQGEASSPEDLDQRNLTGVVSTSENLAQTQKTKGCVCRGVYGDLRRKAAVRWERRRVFGDIDVNKLSLVGGVCTPYQALVLQDYQEVPLTEDLPISPWMQCHSPRSPSEAGLSSLQLSITSSDQEPETAT
ncbi:WD repeat-containing protein on Y chromosome isoform X2 [Osmerus eperlanus]|uniref:WD repeat-containing protein on Y chromosome isoform X2 n=1 Tax=Osmerus eperlanus TaxID=29151 RepID=UPI002E0D230A